jgi:hypothetical protein
MRNLLEVGDGLMILMLYVQYNSLVCSLNGVLLKVHPVSYHEDTAALTQRQRHYARNLS